MDERIQKVLSAQGYCSRRAAEQIIREGRVKLNGHPAGLGDKMDIARDVLSVDGERIYFEKKQQKSYYALYKPRGYVTTLADAHAEKTVAALMQGVDERVYPVGRLDKDSEGLVLMTNDGALTNLITHPRGRVGKQYRVSVRPAPSEEQLISLSTGVKLDDGYVTAQCLVRVVASEEQRGVMEITLYEGKNRQIRRMCDAVGLEVIRLKRFAIGPLRLGMLRPGEYRELKKEELIALRNAFSE
ncbi:MAG: pseudouridine synthase [Oscillospiraceae bacterium]|nr:pseudouridine synthase [Oscillospiraceae bacterium]